MKGFRDQMLIYRRALLKSTTLDTDPLEKLLLFLKRIKYIRDAEPFKNLGGGSSNVVGIICTPGWNRVN